MPDLCAFEPYYGATTMQCLFVKTILYKSPNPFRVNNKAICDNCNDSDFTLVCATVSVPLFQQGNLQLLY